MGGIALYEVYAFIQRLTWDWNTCDFKHLCDLYDMGAEISHPCEVIREAEKVYERFLAAEDTADPGYISLKIAELNVLPADFFEGRPTLLVTLECRTLYMHTDTPVVLVEYIFLCLQKQGKKLFITYDMLNDEL